MISFKIFIVYQIDYYLMTGKTILLMVYVTLSLGLLFEAIIHSDIYAQMNQTAQSINNPTPINQTFIPPIQTPSPTANQTMPEDNQSFDSPDQLNVTELHDTVNTAISDISKNNTNQTKQIIAEVNQDLNTTDR